MPESQSHITNQISQIKKPGKLLTSRRYNRPPLLYSYPGGFSRSWPYKTCQGRKGREKIIAFKCTNRNFTYFFIRL